MPSEPMRFEKAVAVAVAEKFHSHSQHTYFLPEQFKVRIYSHRFNSLATRCLLVNEMKLVNFRITDHEAESCMLVSVATIVAIDV